MISDELLAKYIFNETSTDERTEVERWLRLSDQNKIQLTRLERVIQKKQDWPYPDFSLQKEKSWEIILSKIQSKNDIKSIRSVSLIYRIAASIAVLAFLGLASYFIVTNFFAATVYESANKIESIQLEDGSTITLNKGSRLIVDRSFGIKKRSVELFGEAYFEVAKDKMHPFIISSEKVETKVVGTAFNIKAKNENAEVVVDEGVVIVRVENSIDSLILTVGDGALSLQGKLNSFKNQNLNVTSWKTGIIRFNNSNLKDVAGFLSSHYGIEVKVESSIESLTLTSTLDNLSLADALRIVSETLSIQVKSSNGVMILTPEP